MQPVPRDSNDNGVAAVLVTALTKEVNKKSLNSTPTWRR